MNIEAGAAAIPAAESQPIGRFSWLLKLGFLLAARACLALAAPH